MGIAERKGRERAEREQRITAAARRIAEAEGWNAVTIRRLADEIEYSQPVLYSHFENRDAIVAAVALEGFREFTTMVREAGCVSTDRRIALETVAINYLAFARMHPAVYAAMFTLPTSLRFAHAETKIELKDAFAALVAVFTSSRADVEAATETFWAALHGLAELEGSGRVRLPARSERIGIVVRAFLAI